MPRTAESTEVVAGNPEQLFGAIKNHHEWCPKLVPHVFTDAKRVEGEGHTGSVYHYDIHQDTHDAHGGTPKIKMVMEDYNPQTLSYIIDYQGDPRYRLLKWHLRLLPGPSQNTTDVKWFLEYEPVKAGGPPPHDLLALDLPNAVFKDLAAHLGSMRRTEESTEVVAGNPEQLFGAIKNHHEWCPKLVPHVFTDAKRVEGEGHTGSVYHYDIHQDTHDAHGGTPKIKMVMEDYNPQTLSYIIDYQGDPRYRLLKWHLRLLPGPSQNTTNVKWFLEYEPVKAGGPPPHDLLALDLPNAVFKDLAAHLDSKS